MEGQTERVCFSTLLSNTFLFHPPRRRSAACANDRRQTWSWHGFPRGRVSHTRSQRHTATAATTTPKPLTKTPAHLKHSSNTNVWLTGMRIQLTLQRYFSNSGRTGIKFRIFPSMTFSHLPLNNIGNNRVLCGTTSSESVLTTLPVVSMHVLSANTERFDCQLCIMLFHLERWSLLSKPCRESWCYSRE